MRLEKKDIAKLTFNASIEIQSKSTPNFIIKLKLKISRKMYQKLSFSQIRMSF